MSGFVAPKVMSAQASYTVMPLVPSVRQDTTQGRDQAGRGSVTLDVRDSTIAYVVKALAQQAHQRVFFKDNDPLFAKRVTVHVKQMPIMQAFTSVLTGTGLVARFASDGETVVISRASDTVEVGRAQVPSGMMTGQVTDSASGRGVEGATVKVVGTALSAITSATGEFKLDHVPVGKQEVTVKTFGYRAASRTIEITDGARSRAAFVLAPVATVLSGVVTTATGTQQKLAVGSDITTINVDSVMKTAPIATVTDLLENRVPGLTVVHTSGTPGDPSRLLLRGAASIYGSNNPIVVVDGVRVYDPQALGSIQSQLAPSNQLRNDLTEVPRPSPLDQIDPNTIATIEVLKGPSASALYGSDAANGVIVITTKKGVPGRTHWSVNAMQGVSYVPGGYPTLTYVFGRYASIPRTEFQCVAGAYRNGTATRPCIVDSVRTFQALNDPRFSPLTPGPKSSLSATISGGAQALTYSFTGSAQNTHGMTKLPAFAAEQYIDAVGSAPPTWMQHPDDYVGWSGSGQVQAALSPTASVTVSDMLSSTTQHRTDLGLTAVGALVGTYVDTTNLADAPAYSNFFTQITQGTVISTTNATLNWRIRPWLPLTMTGGYNRTQATDKQYQPAGLPSSILPNAVDTSGRYSLGTQQATVATLNANTTIPLTLGRGPTLQLAAGTNLVSQSTFSQALNTSQVPVGVSDPTTFAQTTATSIYQQSQSAATYGWFLEPQLQLHSRLFITPGLRLDGGTASGNGAGFTVFPKTNFSYIALDRTGEIGQTGGAGWSQVVSLLRLRGSFGIAGVQPTPGQALRLFSEPNVVTLDGGPVSTTGTLLTSLGNTLLHPERSREMEAGFDAQFFQNRATLTVTYYNKLRIDAIEQVTVPPSVGGYSLTGSEQAVYQNVGNIRNRGLEVTGGVIVLDRNAVTWNVNGSVSANSNRVLSTPVSQRNGCEQGQSNPLSTNVCVVAGYPLNAKFTDPVVGYSDLNHDGVIEYNEIFFSDSLAYVGSSDPRYTASFGTTMAFWHGRLSISANGDYQNGLTVFNIVEASVLNSAANQPAADAQTQLLAATYASSRPVGSIPGIQVVNVLRVDAVSMNLTLPTAVARVFRAQQATLSVQGSNLGEWTNYLGKDPLATSAVAGLDAVDSGGLPQPRTWQLAVRITQ